MNLANLHGWKFGVFSPENYPLKLHISKLVEIKTGFPFFGSYNCQRMPLEDVEIGAKWVKSVFRFIDHGDSILTVDDILSKAQKLVDDHKISGLVLDPWNEIDHVLAPGDTETMYISKSLTKIRHFARKNDIHVWIVAHPTKLQTIRSQFTGQYLTEGQEKLKSMCKKSGSSISANLAKQQCFTN